MNSCDRWYYFENFYDNFSSDFVIPHTNPMSCSVESSICNKNSSSVNQKHYYCGEGSVAENYINENPNPTEIEFETTSRDKIVSQSQSLGLNSIKSPSRIRTQFQKKDPRNSQSQSEVIKGFVSPVNKRKEVKGTPSSFRSDILSLNLTGFGGSGERICTTSGEKRKKELLLLRNDYPSLRRCTFHPRQLPSPCSTSASSLSVLSSGCGRRSSSGTNNNRRRMIDDGRRGGSYSPAGTDRSTTESSSHNSDTEFDLDPLPERDERFWFSANDVSVTSLSSTQLQHQKQHIFTHPNQNQRSSSNTKERRFRKKKSKDDDDTIGRATTPLCLVADCETTSSTTRKKSSSFATVKRRLSKPVNIIPTSTVTLISSNSTSGNCNSHNNNNNRSNTFNFNRNKLGHEESVHRQEHEKELEVKEKKNKEEVEVCEETQGGCLGSGESSSSSLSLCKSKSRSLSLPEKLWYEFLQGSSNKARRNSLWNSAGNNTKSTRRTESINIIAEGEKKEEKESRTGRKKYSSDINIVGPKKPIRRIFMMGDLVRNKKELSCSPAGSSSGISSAAMDIEPDEMHQEMAIKTNSSGSSGGGGGGGIEDNNGGSKTKVKKSNSVKKSGSNKWKFLTGRFQRPRSGSGASVGSGNEFADTKGGGVNKNRASVRRRGSMTGKSRPVTIHSIGSVSEVMGATLTMPIESSESFRLNTATTTVSGSGSGNGSSSTKRMTVTPRFLKSFRLKKNKVGNGIGAKAPPKEEEEGEDGEGKINGEKDESHNKNSGNTSILKRKARTTGRTKTNTNIFSTFYYAGRQKFSVKDLDDVTLDLASGELKKTVDGTIIVQTDIVAQARNNHYSHSPTRAPNPKARLALSPDLYDASSMNDGNETKNVSCEDSASSSLPPQLSSNVASSSSSGTGGTALATAAGRDRGSQTEHLQQNQQLQSLAESPKSLLGRMKDFHRSGFSFSSGSNGNGNRDSRSGSGSSSSRRRRGSRCNTVNATTDENGSSSPAVAVDCSLHHQNQRHHLHHRHHQHSSSDDVATAGGLGGNGNDGGKKTDVSPDDFGSGGAGVSLRNSSEEELTSINSCDTRLGSLSIEDEGEGYNGPFDGKAIALVDCTPSPYDRHALRYKKGDVIEIISKKPTGLWTGKVNNQVGHFKFINVQVLPDSDDDDEDYADTTNYHCNLHCNHPNDHHRHHSEQGDLDQNNLSRNYYRRNNKRLTPLSPWELEQRQTVANVINGIRKENSALSQRLAEAEAAAKDKQQALNQNGNSGSGAGSQQKPRKDKAERKKSSSLKKGRPKSVGDLLHRINLEEHISVFILHGFETLDLFKELEEEDLDRLAISNPEDRTKILTAVELLMEFDTEDEIPNQNYYQQQHIASCKRIITPPSNFSRYPRDSGIFVGKCDADVEGGDNDHDPCSDPEVEREPEAETEEIILSPVNLQKSTTAANPYANRIGNNTSAVNTPTSDIPVLERKSKKPGKVLSRNTIAANAAAEFPDFWPVDQTNTNPDPLSLSNIKSNGNYFSASSSGLDNSSNSMCNNTTKISCGVNGDPDAYVDVRQRFLQARSMFETNSSSALPGTNGKQSSDEQSPSIPPNRFLFCEKSSDSGISVCTNSPPTARIG